MNNDALAAALGTGAAAAVHGYRLRVIAEAAKHGLRLVSEPFEVAHASGDGAIVDPVDIRLMFQHSRGHGATPLRLVPDPRHVVEWATGELHGPAARPQGFKLHDHPEAVQRLLGFADPDRPLPLVDALAPEEASVDSSSTRRLPWKSPRRTPNSSSRESNRVNRQEQRTS